jgi:hypothetical protein
MPGLNMANRTSAIRVKTGPTSETESQSRSRKLPDLLFIIFTLLMDVDGYLN